MMEKLKQLKNTKALKHLLFWIGVLAYFVFTANIEVYTGYLQVIEFNIMVVFTQIITAYTCIYVLIPRFLDKKKISLFMIWLLILLIVMFAIYTLFKTYYYDPKYYNSFSEIAKFYAQKDFWYRILNVQVFFSKVIKFLTPTVLLIIAGFYQKQKEFIQLKEQKKEAELSALKNQLNPHFLFNTLNNLYSLSLEKSDRAPEVIERLSEIIDYLLYRCRDKFVPITKEIALLENYIALENLRYGKRVTVNFEHSITNNLNIAPLILLTFLENAFKHSVAQALRNAKIDISLNTDNGIIIYIVKNTKPIIEHSNIESVEEEPLGLKNAIKQLDLIYGEYYDLHIQNNENDHTVTLKLTTNNV